MSKAVDILEKELKEMEKELKMTEPEAKRIENKLLILRSQIQKIKGALEILKNENTIPTFSMGNRISFKYGKRNRELDKEIIEKIQNTILALPKGKCFKATDIRQLIPVPPNTQSSYPRALSRPYLKYLESTGLLIHGYHSRIYEINPKWKSKK